MNNYERLTNWLKDHDRSIGAGSREELAAYIQHLEQTIKTLSEALENTVCSLERLDLREGYCVCGNLMEVHDDFNIGHSAVDMGEYYHGAVIKAAKEALANG